MSLIIILLLLNVSLILWGVAIYFYRKLRTFEASLKTFRPVEVHIGARIAVTKDEETQLSKNKEALKILSKLCEQMISLRLGTIDDKSITDKDFRYLQGEIHALLDIKWRANELYNKKIDE